MVITIDKAVQGAAAASAVVMPVHERLQGAYVSLHGTWPA
jgi:hypothetical protein